MFNRNRRTTIRRGHAGGLRSSASSNTQRRFGGGGRRNVKKLDTNLFVKRASFNPQEPMQMSKTSFTDFPINETIKRNILSHGFTNPTPIQEQSIPHLLQGRDVIGMANTGTGKTAAFLIPTIHKAMQNRNERVLIITPTRELAMQIVDEFYIFANNLPLDAVLCIGGTNLFRQEDRLRRNPQFVIGTPGRIKDLINRHILRVNEFHTIVLDEVDRMVDIGFIRDIQYIISLLPLIRQSIFFSATVSGKVQDILRQFVKNPITVSVVQRPTADNIDQDVVRVHDKSMKVDVLHDLLIKEGFDKVLIFGQTKWGVEKLTKSLVERGFKAGAIHGNKSQGQRQRVLEQFKRNQLQVLLATDVASRGLDIDDVTHVINYDAPESYDDYVHRIGRTGRASKKGIALTFVE